MSSHTPGPWRTGTEPGRERAILTPGAAPFNHVARVAIAWPQRTEEEGEANARLIAAAPDLLEAAKVLLTACYDADAQYDLPFEIDGSYLDAMQKAIDKAQGTK